MHQIIATFNLLLSDFYLSAERVTASANQISRSSITLAQGASEQSIPLNEISSALNAIKFQTQKNAEDAEKANILSEETIKQSEVNKSKMKLLLSSMEEIVTASHSMASIIKLIDDIAAQTTLLALNAAVEAAKHNEKGKGFSVIAEEVHNLAN